MIFLPGMVGLASGLAVAGGMFALLIALGVIARFAGKTNTASWVLYYEDAARIGRHFRKSVQSVSVPYPGWNYRSCIIWVVFRNIYRYLGYGSHRDRRCCPDLHQTNPSERRNSMAHSFHGSGTESGEHGCMPVSVIEHPVPGETQPTCRTRQGRRRYTVHSDGPGFSCQRDAEAGSVQERYSSYVFQCCVSASCTCSTGSKDSRSCQSS